MSHKMQASASRSTRSSNTSSTTRGLSWNHTNQNSETRPAIQRTITSLSVDSDGESTSAFHTPLGSPMEAESTRSFHREEVDEHSNSRAGSLAPRTWISGAPNSTGQAESSRTQSRESNNIRGRVAPTDDRERTRGSRTVSEETRSGSTAEQLVHRVEDEEPPPAFVAERRVLETLTLVKDVTKRITQVMSRSLQYREQDPRIRVLYQEALALSNFQPPSTRIVGLVGDSGVGKSSLINSLLDKDEFTRASGGGAACTCVVTEYHYHDRDDYAIEVDYFTKEELRDSLKELLSVYRQYESSDLTDMRVEDREDLRIKAALAKSTFDASFGNKLSSNPGILDALSFDVAIDTMMEWVTQVLPRSSTQEDIAIMRESFADVQTCSSRLRILTSGDGETRQQSLWPFIRKLRVYLRAHILSKGLILADLPGLRDSNSARQNVTERYIRQCHQLFAVTNIIRATTDVGVGEVFDLARRASLSNVGVVCTHSETIKPNDVGRENSNQRRRALAMQKDIEKLDNKNASLGQKISEIITRGSFLEDAQEMVEIQQERIKTEKLRDALRFELSLYMITFRNQTISDGLQRAYGRKIPGQNLKIFCVSNTLYWEKRKLQIEKARDYLNLSGIIELRRYCIGIVAESHLRGARNYIDSDLPAFLGSLELWVQGGARDVSAERRQEFLRTVSAVQQKLKELNSSAFQIDTIAHDLVAMFNHQFGSYMRDRAARWSAGARDASMSWRSIHHSTYAAFCRHYGTHATKAQPYRCWNEEAISSMKDDMSEQWDNFDRDTKSYLRQIRKSIDEKYKNAMSVTMSTGITQSNDSVHGVLSSLNGTLFDREKLLMYDIDNIIEQFGDNMFQNRTDAFSPIDTSIIGQLMKSIYDQANFYSGTGSDIRKKDTISSGFGAPNLFSKHRRRFGEQFLKLAAKTQHGVKEAVARQVTLIEADLDTLRGANVMRESETDRLFRRRLSEEVARMHKEIETARRRLFR